MVCNTETSTVASVDDKEQVRQRLLHQDPSSLKKSTTVNGQQTITWEELAKHNKPNDAWIGIQGKVYDITAWMERHPGGRDVLELVAGREATHLFESYHLLRDAEKMLGTAKVPLMGTLTTTEFPLYTGKSVFYDTLRERVSQHFEKAGKLKQLRSLSPYVMINTTFILSGMIFSYYMAMYAQDLSFTTCALFAMLSGVFHHLSLVHLWHDVSHNAYTSNSKVWRYFGNIGEILVGHSVEVWRHRHVLGHHIYTNVCGIDPDLGIYKAAPTRPMMKYRAKVKVVPIWFQPFLYFFVTAQMKLDDFYSQTRLSMENVRMNPRSLGDHLSFWGGKAIFLLHRVLLPLFLGLRSPWLALVLIMITEGTSGLLFGVMSQITHISENLEWPSDRPIPKDWAELQVLTAVDYAHDSYVWTYASGFLNYQVVHHLFPSIAPYHYPAILPIVKQTCKEFNIEYNALPSIWQAIANHWNHLKQFQAYRERYYKRLQADTSIVKEKPFSFVDIMDKIIFKLSPNAKTTTATKPKE